VFGRLHAAVAVAGTATVVAVVVAAPCGMVVPGGQPSALLACADDVFVGSAFDGVLDEPHAVSAPTKITVLTKSATNGLTNLALTKILLHVHSVRRRYAAARPDGLHSGR
jgi:hypothetical protein